MSCLCWRCGWHVGLLLPGRNTGLRVCPAHTGCGSGGYRATLLALLSQVQAATVAASQENGLHHALQTYNPL